MIRKIVHLTMTIRDTANGGVTLARFNTYGVLIINGSGRHIIKSEGRQFTAKNAVGFGKTASIIEDSRLKPGAAWCKVTISNIETLEA